MGLALLSTYGIGQLAKKETTIPINSLRYLNAGLGWQIGSNWAKVAGREVNPYKGTVKATYGDVALDWAKRFEESFGGIPRTLDIFPFSAQFLYSKANLTIPQEEVLTFKNYYEKLIGRSLTPEELIGNLTIKEGQLYNEVGETLLSNVRLMPRVWDPKVPGAENVTHHTRLSQAYESTIGARSVSAKKSDFPFLVTGGKTKAQAFGRQAEALGIEYSSRYFRLLDDPVEALAEITSGRVRLNVGERPWYQDLVRNRFGTGGRREGMGLLDLWKTHAKQILPYALGIGVAYAALTEASKRLTDKTPVQWGAEVAARGQLAYTGLSDITGLTALHKKQEEIAPGSTSPFVVPAFGLSGGLTGMAIEAARSRFTAAKTDKWTWAVANQATHELPEALDFLKKIPYLGERFFSKPMTLTSRGFKVGAIAGAALALPFALGMFGADKDTEQLQQEMAGVRDVEIRRDRWWEFSKVPYEGSKDKAFFAPHWYRRAMDDSREVGIYGKEEAGKPVTQFLKSLVDPYRIESRHYFDRPYPISGAGDIGFGPLGSLWNMTIGKILKPPMRMHESELEFKGGTLQIERPEERPAYELGGLKPETPQNPYGLRYQLGELAMRISEMGGLKGFIASSIKKRLTGSGDFFDEDTLASAADIESSNRQYYDQNLGGAALLSEGWRRFMPPDRFQIKQINPIENTMPSWIPSEDYVTNFHQGDPFTKVERGETRMPGPGFAARYPELEDVNPEVYPDIYKHKILGDIAPTSQQFKFYAGRVAAQLTSGELSPAYQSIYDETKRQVAEKSVKKEFAPFSSDSLIGGYWDAIKTVGRMNPLEHLFPISPIHKFAGPVDPLQDYLESQVYSREQTSWDRPIESFIKPALNVALHDMGIDFIPSETQKRNDIEGYFDKLEYTKYRALGQAAYAADDTQSAFAFNRRAEGTVTGVDAYASPEVVERTLPRSERPYFDAFANVDDPKLQAQIRSYVPEYTRPLYEAAWKKRRYAAIAVQDSVSSNEEDVMDKIEGDRAAGGSVMSESIWDAYQGYNDASGMGPNRYADFAKTAELNNYYRSEPLPGPDWIGNSPSVSLDDVKLKVIQEESLNMHDFGLWENQSRSMDRKPYVDEAVSTMRTRGDVSNTLTDMLLKRKLSSVNSFITDSASAGGQIDVELYEDRKEDYKSKLRRMGLIH